MTHKNPKLQLKIDAFRQDFYSRADWALDISEARLSGFDYEVSPRGFSCLILQRSLS